MMAHPVPTLSPECRDTTTTTETTTETTTTKETGKGIHKGKGALEQRARLGSSVSPFQTGACSHD